MGARIMMLFDRTLRGAVHRRRTSDAFRERRHSRSALDAARGRIDRARVPRTRRDRARRYRVLKYRTRAGFRTARRRHRSGCAFRNRSRAAANLTSTGFSLRPALARTRVSSSVAFGRVSGKVCIDGAARTVNGFARAGMSFTGLGPQKFTARRMIWAALRTKRRRVRSKRARSQRQMRRRIRARGFSAPADGRSASCAISRSKPPSVEEPPHRIFASLTRADGSSCEIEGERRMLHPAVAPRARAIHASTRRSDSRASAPALIAGPGCLNIRASPIRC